MQKAKNSELRTELFYVCEFPSNALYCTYCLWSVFKLQFCVKFTNVQQRLWQQSTLKRKFAHSMNELVYIEIYTLWIMMDAKNNENICSKIRVKVTCFWCNSESDGKTHHHVLGKRIFSHFDLFMKNENQPIFAAPVHGSPPPVLQFRSQRTLCNRYGYRTNMVHWTRMCWELGHK